MIECNDKAFRLSTDHTVYLFRVTPFGHLEHLHYGGPVSLEDGNALGVKPSIVRGSSILYDESSDTYCLDDLSLEWSGVGKGDFRNPPAELTLPDGAFTNDFVYVSHEMKSGPLPMEGLPTAYGDDAETLILHLKEKAAQVTLDLVYTVYPREDVITRRAVLKNEGEAPVVIDKLMSYMLDMIPASELTLTTFDGAWIREARRHDRPVMSG
ncbi:MAG: alpha-galactosidase, partial [Clostridia bacterium]|nr:alpha-galactosidase [Clostridia bacterium]